MVLSFYASFADTDGSYHQKTAVAESQEHLLQSSKSPVLLHFGGD